MKRRNSPAIIATFALASLTSSTAIADRIAGSAAVQTGGSISFELSIDVRDDTGSAVGTLSYARGAPLALSTDANARCLWIAADGTRALAAGPAEIRENAAGLPVDEWFFAAVQSVPADVQRVRAGFVTAETGQAMCRAGESSFPGVVESGSFGIERTAGDPAEPAADRTAGDTTAQTADSGTSTAAGASAGRNSCYAYYRFDDTLSDSGGFGYDGIMFGAGDSAAAPEYADGRSGRALLLDGASGMRSSLDLHYDTCPQVTIAAWIRVAQDAPAGTMHLLSTGGGSGPGLNVSGSGLNLTGTENGIFLPDSFRRGTWIFVAGTYDYAAGTYNLYVGGARTPAVGALSQSRYEPRNGFWVGTLHDDWGVFSSGIAIDDLRVIGRTLSAVEVGELRERSTTSAPADTSGMTAGSTAATADGGGSGIDFGGIGSTGSGWNGQSCQATADCGGGGAYCAIDGTCHPESHLPMPTIQLANQQIGVVLPTLPDDPSTSSAGTTEDAPYTGGYHPGDVPLTSALSGRSGTVVNSIDLRDEFLRQIVWANREQFVCRISVRKTGRPEQTETLEYCEHDEAFDVTIGDFVRSMKVCTSSTTGRLRGLQIWGGGISEDGRVDLPSTETRFIENCSRWHEEVTCPGNSLATGLEVHAITHPSDMKDIVGLRLICREPVRDFP